MDRMMQRFLVPAALACAVFAAPLASTAAPAGKIPVTKLSDLPPRTYTIPVKPSEMITNQAAVLDLATAVDKDIRGQLDKYDIQDPTAVRRMKGTLVTVALLKGDDATAHQLILEVRGMQDKPSAKLTSGVIGECLLDTKAAKPADFDGALKDMAVKRFSAMPYDVVQEYLQS